VGSRLLAGISASGDRKSCLRSASGSATVSGLSASDGSDIASVCLGAPHNSNTTKQQEEKEEREDEDRDRDQDFHLSFMFFETFAALLDHRGRFCVSKRRPLVVRDVSLSCQMRVVLCHDLMGGFLEWETDESGASSFSSLSSSHCFNFHHWNLIDTFIYFSHKRISVPRESHRLSIFLD